MKVNLTQGGNSVKTEIKFEITGMVKAKVKVENQSHYPKMIFLRLRQFQVKIKINILI